MFHWIQNSLMLVIDLVYRIIPRPVPDHHRLQQCKVIAHRGEHDNRNLIENTLPAFKEAIDHGIWGIECDIRWTRDLVPVISHDASGRRLFGCPLQIRDLSFVEMRETMPLIPSLEELIRQCGKVAHLMLEIKDEPYPDQVHQQAILKDLLQDLTPGEDYHFLSLNPALFDRVDFVSSSCCIPVSEINARSISRQSLEVNLGGLTGHFLLLTNHLKQLHESRGQKFGTGFIASRNCLFRELNRDVFWIFTNHAVRMQKIRDRYLNESSG